MTNRGGTYSWPEAVNGQTVSQMCQYGVDGQNVTRYCNEQIWTEDSSTCPTVVTKQFQELSSVLQNVRLFKILYSILTLTFHQQTISAENVVNVTSQLKTLVSQAKELVDQSASNLDVVTTVITQIANISSPTAAPVQKEVHDE